MTRSLTFFSFMALMFPAFAYGDTFNFSPYGTHSVSISPYGLIGVSISPYGEHTVCVPIGSTEKQIREYVAAAIVVALELKK